MQSKVLVILGMHRSGTSLITNWLNKCGLHVGERLQEASPSNPDGHFEDLEFKRLHEEILTDNRWVSSGLVDVHDVPVSAYHTAKLNAIISAKNSHYRQWGWKDPRTCLFLNTYRQLLPGAKYLVILRDYQSVINSLLKRDFSDFDDLYLTHNFLSRLNWNYHQRKRRLERYYKEHAALYLKVWIAYNKNILALLKEFEPKDYLVVDYVLLKRDDKEVFNNLTLDWGFSLSYVNFMDIYKPSLMSVAIDLDRYITDKVLIDKAGYIENRLRSLIRTNNGKSSYSTSYVL